MKVLSYDIETYDIIDDNNKDLMNVRPSVAATCTNEDDVTFWYDEPYMSKETARNLVHFMLENLKIGILPFTWNGLAFDFKLLGYYSGMIEECAHLALNGIDGMLLITFRKGFYLGLDAALRGANLETKTHHVKLNDGSEITDMSGAKAPEMWQKGEYEAVKTYLNGDVIQPLKLTNAILLNNGIRWTSKVGKPNFVQTTLDPVKKLFSLPIPDTSWMQSAPPSRKDFVNWIPEDILKKYEIEL